MSRRILIQKGYTMPDRYIELEQCEELCEKCKGTGKYRQYFGPPGGWDGLMECLECGGDGKRVRCSNCHELLHHGLLKHEGAEWMNTLCLKCIEADERFKTVA